MAINHRIMRWVFALSFGLLVAYGSYKWITTSDRAFRRGIEEEVVRKSRAILASYVADREELRISDPLDRVRAAGKVYIFPNASGWEISGQYRRQDEKAWHPYLMDLDRDSKLVRLSVEDTDPELVRRAATDPLFEVVDSK